ncbi:hypothetical protein D030_1664A, partial [Vibrio parahaemolyticus AQ3810]|jgi:calcium-dependent protein kinase
MFTD